MKNYVTSKNYTKLKELLDSGAEVVCYDKCRLFVAQKMYGSYNLWHDRGGFSFSEEDGAFPQDWATFSEACEANNIEFIEPNMQYNETISKNAKRQII